MHWNQNNTYVDDDLKRARGPWHNGTNITFKNADDMRRQLDAAANLFDVVSLFLFAGEVL